MALPRIARRGHLHGAARNALHVDCDGRRRDRRGSSERLQAAVAATASGVPVSCQVEISHSAILALHTSDVVRRKIVDEPIRSVGPEYDPITLSVMLGRFDSIVREMTRTLEHTAWTSILAALPRLLVRGLRRRAAPDQHVRRAADPHDLRCISCSGDRTDLRRGNQTTATSSSATIPTAEHPCRRPRDRLPVFHEGRPVLGRNQGASARRGRVRPSSVTRRAQNVWQEGIQIPPLKLIDRGVMRAMSSICTSRTSATGISCTATCSHSSRRSRRAAQR